MMSLLYEIYENKMHSNLSGIIVKYSSITVTLLKVHRMQKHNLTVCENVFLEKNHGNINHRAVCLRRTINKNGVILYNGAF